MNLGIQFDNKLVGKTYLVTGASGFIGGRIVERICRDYKGKVKALVNNLGHAARIARFDIEIIPGNILDEDHLCEITKNVDYVIHCAFGNTSDTDLNRKITVEGTQNIAKTAHKNKVKRFVYFSTMSVYGNPLPHKCNEFTPYKRVKGDYYNNDKLDAEEVVNRYIKKGLAGIILQPTIVYGPYASLWTVWVVNQLKERRLFLVDHGKGLANSVFIDNVVDAVFLSLMKDEAVGEKFIISDCKAISWKDFFSYYQRIISSESIPEFDPYKKYKYIALTSIIDTIKNMKQKFVPFPLFKEQNIITRSFDRLSMVSESMNTAMLDVNLHNFFKERCVFDISKAKKILGYYPRISLDEGMRLTTAWLRYARLIN